MVGTRVTPSGCHPKSSCTICVAGCRYDFVVSNRRQLVQAHRDEILRIVRLNRGKRAYLFGSTARGDDGESSDIDLLIEFEEGSSLFDLKHVEDDLSGLLGVNVDVVSVGGLLERDEHIRREAIPI